VGIRGSAAQANGAKKEKAAKMAAAGKIDDVLIGPSFSGF
jgi:hypothetical protein